MSSIIEQVLALADVDKCLEETGATSTYGHCHNACGWLVLQIKRAGISDFNIFWCSGTFWGKDHSWLMVQEENPDDCEQVINTVVDMTVNQFVDREVPYSAVMTDEYDIHNSVILCMDEQLREFVEGLG